jgi:hypothetical protein
MAALFAGLPVDVSGVTVNRLCGSGMEAVVQAARAIKAGEANPGDCRWRGVYVPRAVRDGQGDERV